MTTKTSLHSHAVPASACPTNTYTATNHIDLTSACRSGLRRKSSSLKAWIKHGLAIATGLLLVFSLAAHAAEAIDINRADATTLAKELKGVGSRKAEAIVLHRQQHGPFTSIDQLTDVKGIGAGLIAANRDKISLSEQSGAQ